jgi:ectoine hydroxylase-related dioxygenase (phytanoyl-CoA dioxygenase family)
MFPYPKTIDLDVVDYNIYNCQSWSITPKNNDIILFPSMLEHSSEPNRTDIPRYCIAFNVFVRGTFGILHKLDIK